MRCSKCENYCTAVSSKNFEAVSNCCEAKIIYIQHHNTVDYSKDAMQGNWHGGQHTSGSVTGYPKQEKTLRDEIAIAAMQGLISLQNQRKVQPMEVISKWAYEQADAMMKERNK